MSIKFKYPVYNPCIDSVDVAADWGINCVTGTNDLNLVLEQPYKIAALRVFFDEPWVHSYNPALNNLDLSRFDLILLSDIEYYSPVEIRQWIKNKQIKNYVLATSGINSNEPLNKENELYRPYWIRRFFECNTYQETDLDNKPYLFDMLLGARRPHRDYAMLAMTETGLLNRSIVTYRDCFTGGIVNQQSDEFSKLFTASLKWPYISPNLQPQWEVADQITNAVSFDSPTEIFKNTYYSIICETLGTGSTFFLSEKTIKAMYNNRLFVMFAGPGYLKQLANHGFRTFDPIINETYDNECRDFRRYNMVMHEIMQLAWFENPQEILLHTKETRNHNRQQLINLEEKRIRDQQEMLLKHIPVDHWLF